MGQGGGCNEDDVLTEKGEPFWPAYSAACEYARLAGKEVWRETRPRGTGRPAIERLRRLEGATPAEALRSVAESDVAKLGETLGAVMYGRRYAVDVNLGSILLRRPAIRRYLETCGLAGVSRLLAGWFGAERVAIGKKTTDVKDWIGKTYANGIPAGTTILEIRRRIEKEAGILVSISTIPRALRLKK
jgi:hypothetical protein